MDRVYKDFLKIAEACVGKGETTEQDLDSVGKAFFGDDFAGVFAVNEVPTTTQFKYAIANLDKRGEAGTHWVALANLGNDVYMVYDSYGRKKGRILPALDLPTMDTEYDAEQTTKQNNCGARCLAWLLLFDEFGAGAAQSI